MHPIKFYRANSASRSTKINLKLFKKICDPSKCFAKMGAPHNSVSMNKLARLERLAASESRALNIVPKARIESIDSNSKKLEGENFHA